MVLSARQAMGDTDRLAPWDRPPAFMLRQDARIAVAPPRPAQDSCRTCILQRGGHCCAEPPKAYHREVDSAVVSYFPKVSLDQNWCGRHTPDTRWGKLLWRLGLAG